MFLMFDSVKSQLWFVLNREVRNLLERSIAGIPPQFGQPLLGGADE